MLPEPLEGGDKRTEAGAATGDSGSGGAGLRCRRRSWRALGWTQRSPDLSDARRWSAKPVSLASARHSVSRGFPPFRASPSLFPTPFESLKW
uniref:Uncharacterized protein n=1 Tax=Gorilla gorilla gorilla TaxID=9595 RepID=A0A2I2Y289_GORGO